MKVGQIPFRLLQSLCDDFHRPFRLGTLHHRLYPGEYFNPQSAALRVHRAVYRLRELLERFEIPLKITEHSGQYRLDTPRSCMLTIPLEGTHLNGQEYLLSKLERRYQNHSFSSREAASYLNIGERTIQRLISMARHSGRLTSDRQGSAFRYVFVSKPAKKVAA